MLTGILLLGSGCASDPAPDPGKTLEEIRTENSNSTSRIIRNPVSAEGPKDTVNVARMTFEETEFLFGEVYEGDVVTHSFRFTNTGRVPLLINDARSTCGCTVPRWPKDPIAPGESGEIRVEFNTTNKKGLQEKPVTITANTYPSANRIFLKGKVLDPKAGE